MQSSPAALAAAAAAGDSGTAAGTPSPAPAAAPGSAREARQAPEAPEARETHVTQEAPAPRRRVALVTGAARRLGRAIALALARDGWDIGVHFATSEEAALETAADIRRLGRQAVCLKARLEDPQATGRLLGQLSEQLGPVCGLVNNASRFVHDDIGSVNAVSLTDHLLPNLIAPLLLSQSFFKALRDSQDDGVIINLLDQKLYNLNPDFLSYTVAKAGLAAATTMLAQALAPRVRVVGIAPGLTFPSYLQDADAFKRAYAAFSPLGRSSTPDDVAAAVVFAMNNRSLTGTVIQVDGGQHLHGMPRDASLV
jgi:NAD(P)-dependent dehydrogenase (short-subunit alcohol dehydrogenase family)